MNIIKPGRSFAIFAIAAVLAVSLCFAGSLGVSASEKSLNIQLNGEYMQFTDQAPMIVSDRVMLPYRQLFETLGASVDWNESTGEITGQNPKTGMSLTMRDGEKTIHVVYPDGTEGVTEMDVAPFVTQDSNRTMVPVRFVSEVLNYSVGWDNNAFSVVIIDPYTIIPKEASSDYSVIMSTANLNLDPAKTYELNGSGSMIVNAGGTNVENAIDISGISSGKKANITVENKTGDSAVSSTSITDLDAGTVFFNGTMPDGSSAWYKIDLNAVLPILGINLNTLSELGTLSQNTADYSDTFALTVKSMADSFNVATYDALRMSSDMVKNVFGDSAFERTANEDGTVLYKSTFNDLSSLASPGILSEALANIPLNVSAAMSILQNPDGTAKSVSFDLSLSPKDSSNPFKSCSVNITQDDRNFDMSVNALSSESQVAIDLGFTFTETSKSVDTSLPAGVNPMDMTELIKMLLGAVKDPSSALSLINISQ